MAGQAGYSGRPLATKLGLKDGMTCWRHAMPQTVSDLLNDQVPNLILVDAIQDGLDFAHVFTKDRAELERLLASLRHQIASNGMIWVSWPKKASKIPSSVTEDTVRELCLPMGLVDVKVCAVDEIWSGLKLVIRKELR